MASEWYISDFPLFVSSFSAIHHELHRSPNMQTRPYSERVLKIEHSIPGFSNRLSYFSACGRTWVHTPISREKDREWAHHEAEWCSGMIGIEVESGARERKRKSLSLSQGCRVLH